MPSVPDSLAMMAKSAEADSPTKFSNPLNRLGLLAAFSRKALGTPIMILEGAHRAAVDYPRRLRRGQQDAAMASLAEGVGTIAATRSGSSLVNLGALFWLPVASSMVSAKYDTDGRARIGADDVKAMSGGTAALIAGGVGAAGLGTAALVDWLRRRKARKAKAESKPNPAEE